MTRDTKNAHRLMYTGVLGRTPHKECGCGNDYDSLRGQSMSK